MSRYRTINVNLDRGYRNDLNHNFQQIEQDIAKTEDDIKKVESETLAKVEEIVGGGFIESLEVARDSANTSATEATTQAVYAKNQGDHAKLQGDYAKAQGDYAQLKGTYADEKALAATTAAALAEQEASNLGQLKIDVTNATQSANVAATNAEQKAVEAETAASNANTSASAANEATNNAIVATQATEEAITNANNAATNAQNLVDTSIHLREYNPDTNYVKNNEARLNGSSWRCLKDCKGIEPFEGEYWTLVAQRGVDGTGAVSTVNNKAPDESGNVQLTPNDVGAITKQEAQTLASQAETNAIESSISRTDIGVAGGVAKLNEQGKVVDALGNEVEGKVTSVNGQIGEVKIDHVATADDSSTLGGNLPTHYATAQSVTEVSDRIDILNDKLTKNNSISVDLNRGLQIITVEQDTPVNVLNITGRTVINYAPLFDSGLWQLHTGVTVNSGRRVTLVATATAAYSFVQILVKTNTVYRLTVEHDAFIGIFNTTSTPIYNYTRDKTFTFNTSDNGVIRVYLSNGNLGAGTFYFDGVTLTEGTQQQHFVANVQGITNPTIEVKRIKDVPTTIQANFEGKVIGSIVENPHIMRHLGKSTLASPSEFTDESGIVYENIQKLDTNTQSKSDNVEGNMAQQLFSFNVIEEVERKIGRIPKQSVADKIKWLNTNIDVLSFNWYGYGRYSPGATKASFGVWEAKTSTYIGLQTHSNYTPDKLSFITSIDIENLIDSNGFAHILTYGDPAGATLSYRSYIYTDYVELKIQLKSNSEILFEEPQSLTLLGAFHEGDTVNSDGTVTRKHEELMLDDSFNWETVPSSYVGYKRVRGNFALQNAKVGANNPLPVCVKFNGAILRSVLNFNGEDEIIIHANDKDVNMTISNSDTGFGQNYNPTVDEWKAFFRGWKMANTTVGWDEPYNGTGTKGWYRIDNNGNKADGVYTLPTTQAPINSKWQPYRLLYDLATPISEQVKYIGSILLHEGTNQIELTEGRIVRERTNPSINNSQTNAYINIKDGVTGIPDGSKLKNQEEELIAIYKNGVIDNSWEVIIHANAFGNKYYRTNYSNFNPTAVYEVDYIPLEPYKLTAPTNPITVEYQDKLPNVVDELVNINTNQKSEINDLKRQLPQVRQDIYDVNRKTGDLTELNTEHKETLVGAINEINEKPSGGNDSDEWELLDTIVLSDTNKWYAIGHEFKNKLQKLKFVFKTVTNHWTTTGSVPASNLYVLFQGGGDAGKHRPTGYIADFNTTGASFFKYQYNAAAKDNHILLTVPSSSAYPHPEINGELIFENKNMSAGRGSGYPNSLFMNGWMHIVDTKNTTHRVPINYRYNMEFMAYDPNGNHGTSPHSIIIRIDRTPEFTEGTIEVWGVSL